MSPTLDLIAGLFTLGITGGMMLACVLAPSLSRHEACKPEKREE